MPRRMGDIRFLSQFVWTTQNVTGENILGRGRRLRAANQLRVNRTALPFSHPHVTPQSQSLPSNRFVRFTL
ncbi:hypothetical protein J6590_083532 [Homalodisca vitripennis]|nr:hypothetical protein J6590_083532 [Homalodisca vitripennis]